MTFNAVAIPSTVTFWRHEYHPNFQDGSPFSHSKITLTGLDQFNVVIEVTRDPTTCEWVIPTVTHQCGYTQECYNRREDNSYCPDVSAGTFDTRSGTCDVSFTPSMLDPALYVRFHDIGIAVGIPAYWDGGSTLRGIRLEPLDPHGPEYNPCGTTQLTLQMGDAYFWDGSAICDGGQGSADASGSTATSTVTDVCCDEPMVNQVTFSVSGVPSSLVQWERFEADGSWIWSKRVYEGFERINGTHIFTRDADGNWSTFPSTVATVTTERYDEIDGCPGNLISGPFASRPSIFVSRVTGTTTGLHTIRVAVEGAASPYGELVFRPTDDGFDACGTSDLTAISFTKGAAGAYGGCEITTEEFYGTATSAVV